MMKQQRLVYKLFLIPLAMFGFGYLMIPLYDVFADIAGLNGKTGSVSAADASSQTRVEDRLIKVQFLSSVNESGPWEFKPDQVSMMVHPGQIYNATYTAKNLTNKVVVTQSVPSVAPSKAAEYFNKTSCFCFTEQIFEANEERILPLTFIIDADLAEEVDMINLSYTLFTKSIKS